ncbi:MAG: metallophosphoesterase [Verrucomicrobiota bacterium]
MLADTHVAADPDLIANGAPLAGNLKKVVAEIFEAAKSKPIDGVIVNGDCAFMEGQEGDYRTLGKTLEPLQESGIPVHLTMGNHDDREKMISVMSERKPYNPLVAGKYVSIIESRTANWFLLDTLEIVNRVTGALGDEQLSWLHQALSDRRDKPAIIVGHHYLQKDRQATTVTGLRDTELFKKLLSSHRHIAAYVSGHSHDWQYHPAETTRVNYVSLPPTAYVFNKSRPNGWVLATLTSSGLQLILHSLDHTHHQHLETHALNWA